MATFLTTLLIATFLIPAFVALPLLAAFALRAFLKSVFAWIATALLLPHFASKAMDRMYDAFVSGNYLLALIYLAAFVAIVIGIRAIVKYELQK